MKPEPLKGHYGTNCTYGIVKEECSSCYLKGCNLRHKETQSHKDIENYDDSEEYYSRNKIIRLSQDDLYGICGVLSYDLALNQMALKTGFHPVSGYTKCDSHLRNIEKNKEYIKLLGNHLMDIPEEMLQGLENYKKKVKERLEGLIQFHEDRIEELIKEWKKLPFKYFKGDGWEDWVCSSDGWDTEKEIIKFIQQEYKSIMAIEHWLEDVI